MGDVGGDLGRQWMCVLARMSDEFNLYEKCKESWQFENPDGWSHYDHKGTFLVAARTKFVLRESACEVVMVEMVFDADVLTREQEFDAAAVQFNDWTGIGREMNVPVQVGLDNEAYVRNRYLQRRSLLREWNRIK
ncbi:hypothetical protein INS49_000232 [Diaporthe citri]|uniref:uncharacterized protein n=1 Tax=Diaporthe citri TaxID=83186 RepID=UPI001C7EB11D|nr:uncharacterized protein INS49_000232 [Diaporthe citri]KAG6366056.1 hypothetical protein INS49_000232 [Diaporthe citri]